ncbi:NAD(P)-dependent oxidoreductase [Cytophagaceae bacterium 50C-KIRBA]|uniref:NAD(P)-dependent oxidoreductase n=1 Tax=Aquirufa beregesia TaxID=2516556 RepID=A0ABX0EUM8_9BACT|nr:NAD(P)-dependent oxidoreductase [Aquirufa beregesia]NGZ43793.1 NAD(P)-dependent oxidoreductase [Aquirufa beregesia]
MKILITGANGYVGARLAAYFAKQGHQVIPLVRKLDRNHLAWASHMLDVLKGDIKEEETIQRIASIEADVIIHLVSLDHRQSEADPSVVNEVNVLPTWRLLHACIPHGLKKFIYFSTAQVYGGKMTGEVNETYPINTGNIYGLTHFLGENICQHFNTNSSCNVISVRLSNSYGSPVFEENNCWWLAINDLCRSAYYQKEIRLLSDGSPQRDFIHGNDVCQALDLLIGSADKIKDNVYHISSGNTISLLGLACKIQAVYESRFGINLPIYTIHGLVDSKQVLDNHPQFMISNQKLQELGFLPQMTLEEGIMELFDYFEQQ